MERLPGVTRAEVRLDTRQARVVYDDTKQTPEKLVSAIEMLGFKASLTSITEAPKSDTPAKR